MQSFKDLLVRVEPPVIAPLAPSQDTTSDQLNFFYRSTPIPFTRHSPLPVQAQGANVANSQSIAKSASTAAIVGAVRNPAQIPPSQTNQGASASINAGNGISITANTVGALTISYTGFFAPVSHKFLTGLDGSDVFSAAQPGFSDLSGSLALSQTPLTTSNDLLTVNAGVLARVATGTAHQTLHGGNAWGLVDLGADVSANLPVGNLNSGTNASGSTYWRGDGVWDDPFATTATSASAGAQTLPANPAGFIVLSSGKKIPYYNT